MKSCSFCLILLLCIFEAGCIIPEQQYNPPIAALTKTLPRAENGEIAAQFELSRNFSTSGINSQGVGHDAAAARRYLISAAENNDPAAQVELGHQFAYGKPWIFSYSSGPLVPIDTDAAIYWFERAASQHYQPVFFQLINFYSKDYKTRVEACQWQLLSTSTNPCKYLSDEDAAAAREKANAWRKNHP